MTDTTAARAALEAFGEAYQYDASYLTELLDASPGAFATFQAAQGMSQYRDALPLDAHFVARVAVTLAEDCGECGNLNLRMAVEAGVDRDLLTTLVKDPSSLSAPLRDIRDHAAGVTAGEMPDPERANRIRAHYGDSAFAELAVLITGSRIYPTVKRALLHWRKCELTTLDF